MASEIVEREGRLVGSGQPEPRWWFTSRSERLEATVREVIAAEQLERSLILPPDVFGSMPTTDGGPFHLAGVPLVNFLTAPFYLFDAIDTLDKIHRPSLVPRDPCRDSHYRVDARGKRGRDAAGQGLTPAPNVKAARRWRAQPLLTS